MSDSCLQWISHSLQLTMASLLVITGLQSPQLTLIPSVWTQLVTQSQGTFQSSSLLQSSPLHLKHHSLLLSPFPNVMVWILGSLSQASHSLYCCNITHSLLSPFPNLMLWILGSLSQSSLLLLKHHPLLPSSVHPDITPWAMGSTSLSTLLSSKSIPENHVRCFFVDAKLIQITVINDPAVAITFVKDSNISWKFERKMYHTATDIAENAVTSTKRGVTQFSQVFTRTCQNRNFSIVTSFRTHLGVTKPIWSCFKFGYFLGNFGQCSSQKYLLVPVRFKNR